MPICKPNCCYAIQGYIMYLQQIICGLRHSGRTHDGGRSADAHEFVFYRHLLRRLRLFSYGSEHYMITSGFMQRSSKLLRVQIQFWIGISVALFLGLSSASALA